MVRIGICEDVYEELMTQKQKIEGIMARLSKNVEILCFQTGEDLLCEMDTTGKMDIVFLDIAMERMNGVETAKAIRLMDNWVILIFISSHDQYCKELIQVWPFAFLDKPLDEQKLFETLQKAVQTRITTFEDYTFYFQKVRYSIPLTEILYFRSDRRTIHVNTVGRNHLEKEYIFYERLGDVERKVENSNVKFLRIRSSFLVNTQFIAKYSADKIEMQDGTMIEISKKYKNKVKQFYISFLEGNG